MFRTLVAWTREYWLPLSVSAFIIAFLLWFPIGSSSNLDWVKQRADKTWKEQGFEIVAYEGFQWGMGGFGTPYGGAKVWYRLRKVPDNGLTYSGLLQRWGDEVHVYGPEHAETVPLVRGEIVPKDPEKE